MSPPRNLPLIACLTLAGCGGADAAPGARVTIDTLPNGAVSVMSEGPTAWADTNGWKLVEDLRFSGGKGVDKGELSDPADLAIGEHGRIYVFDTNPAVIKVYGPDGTFLHTIGREGKGPGEFQIAFPAIFDSLLIAHDPQTVRTTVFDTAGHYLRSWRATCCWWMPIHVDDDGRIATPVMTSFDSTAAVAFVRTSITGETLDTMIVPTMGEEHRWTLTERTSRYTFPVPHAPATGYELLANGGVIMGYSDTYRLIEMKDGDTVRVIGRTWTPESIPERQRDSTYDAMVDRYSERHDLAAIREAVSKDDIPATYPAWTEMISDRAGRLWLLARSRLDVFDRNGIYLGQVPTPSAVAEASANLRWGSDGRLYVISTDDDGFPVIVRLHVDSSAVAVR